MEFKDYLESLRNKSVAVIGIGVSNQPLIRLLLHNGIAVTACDRKDRESLGLLADQLEAQGCRLQLGEAYLQGLNQDIIFRTPGMRPDLPELRKAVEQGSVLTSEMEAFLEVCPCPIVAVTGSDGKTTTTTIISELLKADGRNIHLGGNIGYPLLAETGKMSAGDLTVLELSSFQLMTMTRSPHIAVMTNLAPNHLDVHTDYQEYISAKENIFTHQTAADIAVFNADNEVTAALTDKALGEVRLFSRKRRLENGVFLDNGTIYEAVDGYVEPIMQASDILLPGVHNIENYMAAFAAVQGLVRHETMVRVAKTFGGVEHRIELIRTRNNVRWYNDSIASSPSRTIAGLNAFPEKVILIAGGKDKGISYDELGPVINEHVKLLLLCGATAGVIRSVTEAAGNYHDLEIIDVENYQEAVSIADNRAEAGDVVILSPASTSFDRFANFMERGRVFKEIVNALK